MNQHTLLSDKDVTNLAKRIAKESKGVKVKKGKTNGRACLHVIAPGNGGVEPKDGIGSRTIYSPGEWETHPANQRFTRNKDMAETQGTEAVMAANKGVAA